VRGTTAITAGGETRPPLTLTGSTGVVCVLVLAVPVLVPVEAVDDVVLDPEDELDEDVCVGWTVE
jgi:hypothetical protein